MYSVKQLFSGNFCQSQPTGDRFLVVIWWGKPYFTASDFCTKFKYSWFNFWRTFTVFCL